MGNDSEMTVEMTVLPASARPAGSLSQPQQCDRNLVPRARGRPARGVAVAVKAGAARGNKQRHCRPLSTWQ